MARRRPAHTATVPAPEPVAGEINVMRTDQNGLGVFGGLWQPFVLDVSRVDYDLARSLYYNNDERYKLGAGFAKPVVNTVAGFVGVPKFTHENDDAASDLEHRMERWAGKLARVTRNTVRDGDCFVRVVLQSDRFGVAARDFDLQLIPPEWVTPVPDPINGGYLQIVIRWPVKEMDPDRNVVAQYTVRETITPTRRVVQPDDNAPAAIKERLSVDEPNRWGFIPIVHFANEKEEHQIFGRSDLEPVEPFMRAYHEVMINSIQGSQLFSRPKAVFTLKSVATFLANNFTEAQIREKKLDFRGKEIWLMSEGESASFLTADQGLAGIVSLLELIFYCIVDVSETPEFAFGTAVSSSKASVSEQQMPFAKKIGRKRAQFEVPYVELASMYLAMAAKFAGRNVAQGTLDIEWDEVNERDESAAATALKAKVDALSVALSDNAISLEAYAEALRQIIPEMLPWSEPDSDMDEQRRVAEGLEFVNRVQDRLGLNPDPNAAPNADPNTPKPITLDTMRQQVARLASTGQRSGGAPPAPTRRRRPAATA